MQEEVTNHMRVAVIVLMTSALISTVITMCVMGMQIMYDYNEKYVSVVADTPLTGLSTISRQSKTTAPNVYVAIENAISFVDSVYITDIDGTTRQLYQYNDLNMQNTIALLTTYRTTEVKVTLSAPRLGSKMLRIDLEVIK